MSRFRPNTDYTAASQVDENGYPAFVAKHQITDGTGKALAISNTMGIAGGQATYVANFTGYAGYATMTDMFCLSASGSKTVAVLSFWMVWLATAANNFVSNLDFIKRTTANTGGSPTTINPVQNDSTDPVATASFVSYGAAPSALGTATAPSGGVVRRVVNPQWAGATAVPTFKIGLDGMSSVILDANAFSVMDGRKQLLLRPGESLCINANSGSAPAGFAVTGGCEWIEF